MRDETWEIDETILLFGLKYFRTQERAFAYVDRHNEKRLQKNLHSLHVFAREFSQDGRRYFVVEEISTFFEKYTNMRCKDRTFYEIVRCNHPCRLYFDLEYDKTINEGVDDDLIMTIFRKKLVKHIKDILGVDLFACFGGHSIRDFFVEIDSSNAQKFSRHVIISLPGENFFFNDKQMGQFVRLFCSNLTKEAAFGEQVSNFSGVVQEVRRLFFT